MRTEQPAGKRRRRIIIAVLALAVILGAYAIFKRAGSAGSDQTTYEFGAVERGDVRSSVSATGTVQPWKVVDVKSDVAGRIVNLAVDLGDRVRSGQLIAVIDPTDSQVALNQASAQVAAARARSVQAEQQARAQPGITDESIREAQSSLEAAQTAVTRAEQSKAQLEQELAQVRDVTNPQNIEDAESNLQQARANVKAQEAEYRRQAELLAKGYASKRDVETAEADLATQRSALRIAEQRQKTVRRDNELAVKQLETRIAEAASAIKESQARVRQQRASLAVAQKNTYQDRVRAEEVRVARADITRSEAQLKQAATNLSYTRIVAPRDGVVLAKNVEQGTVVPSSRGSIGSTNALLQLGDMSQVWIVCQVDETDIAQVSVRQRVSIVVDAYPEARLSGRVIRIDPQATLTQNVTTIPVTVEVDSPDPRLKPGMNATCEFILAEARDTLMVPNEALQEMDGKYSIQKMIDGKIVDVPVTIGVMGDDTTQVLSGLKAGEEVITRVIKPEEEQPNNPLAFGPRGRGGGTGSGPGRALSGGSSGGGTAGGRPSGGSSGSGPRR